MQRLLKRPGYRLYSPDSPEARALLAEQGLGPADLDRALAGLERTEGTAVRTIVGINEDGVFGVSRAGWRPDLPDAHREPFVPLLWLKVHELLGRVPERSTARFVRDGTLRSGAVTAATTAADDSRLAAEQHDVGELRSRPLPAEPPGPLRGRPGAPGGASGGRSPRRAGPRSEGTPDEDHPCERCHLPRDRRARRTRPLG